MTQSAAEVAAMLGLAEDDPVVVEALEAQAIADKEARAKLRVARTLGDHLESGAKDPFANLEAGYAPRGDAARRLGRTTPEPKPEHLGKAPKKPAPAPKKPAAKKKKKRDDAKPAAAPKKKAKREAPPPSEDESEDDAAAAPPARKSAASATSSASAALPPTGGDSSSDDEEAPPPPPPKPAPKAKRRPKKKPRQSEAEECADDGWKNFAHELLPKMNLTSLKKMLATLKPLAKDAYKAAMAAREGKDAAAAQKVVRALFEHIPRDAILDAYAGATRKFQLPN